LFPGTQKENMIDRDNKGRVAHGESSGTHVLTFAKVREIRSLYERGKGGRARRGIFSQSAIAHWFGVDQGTVSRIVNGKRWKHSFILPAARPMASVDTEVRYFLSYR
jgi:hypothetical protein